MKSWLNQNSVPYKTGSPSIRKVKLIKKKEDEGSMLRKFSFGTPTKSVPEKVIMVVGATGAGKSTLINGMINHIFGVEFGDSERYVLITDETTSQNQAESQTSFITAYTIYHRAGFTVPYTLTIIDTPVFGDTRGIERDQKITDQIREFFTMQDGSGISHIDTQYLFCHTVSFSQVNTNSEICL